VKEALVVGLSDPYRGEAPHAYVTLEAEAGIDGEALRDWLNPQLGRHERVDRVVIRDALPKTMIGKLSRKDLLAEIAAEHHA
jgi:long-chain acyl-CoA synthetase